MQSDDDARADADALASDLRATHLCVSAQTAGVRGEVVVRPAHMRKQRGLAEELAPAIAAALVEEHPPAAGWAGVPRVSHVDASSFEARFGAPQEPCLLEGCSSKAEWPAGEVYWSPPALVAALGSDRRLGLLHGDATVSLGEFAAYCGSSGCASDDSPAYVFEPLVGDGSRDITSRFAVPPCGRLPPPAAASGKKGGRRRRAQAAVADGGDGLGADLFGDADARGSARHSGSGPFGWHRWLLFGAARSGSTVHCDPLATSAWNTLLLGSKLWVLFPPATLKEVLGADPKEESAAAWFATTLPKIEAQVARGSWDTAAWGVPRRGVQRVGDTVYVPAGWWHAVLNLETTTSVTQNFAEARNYDRVCPAVYAEAELRLARPRARRRAALERVEAARRSAVTVATAVAGLVGGTAADPSSDDADGSAGSDGSDDDDAVSALDLADEWRRSVQARWPALEAAVTDGCVYCGKFARGKESKARFAERPVCGPCGAAREAVDSDFPIS